MAEGDGDPRATPARHTVVGAFDDTTHAARARRDLAAAGFAAEVVPPQADLVPAIPASRADSPDIARQATLGGAFVGAIVGWLVGAATVAMPGLVIIALVGTALGAAVGTLLGRPVPARDARATDHLLQVQVGGEQEEGRVRALFSRAGASNTWAYRVPPARAMAPAAPTPRVARSR